MAEHNSRGKWGEVVATELLISKGYVIVERNWRCGHLEIDLIATKGNDIVFVEVKTRVNDNVNPFESINRRKIQNLCSAARGYLKYSRSSRLPRFDVIAVVGNEHEYKVEHVENAFYAPLKTYR